MALWDSLLEQARHLTDRERGPGRPRQASLRRAISAAYYALFHFLVGGACSQVVGVAADRRAVRALLARAFKHSEMREACRQIIRLSAAGQPFRGFQIPVELVEVARTLCDAQEERHSADYDLSASYTRDDVNVLLGQVDQAIGNWVNIRDQPVANLFLLHLLLHKKLARY